jgi:hypothetical protein
VSITSRPARLRLARPLLVLAAMLACVLTPLVATPGTAHAELVPCDPLYNCPDPPYQAPEWIAVGRDADLDDAYDEAAAQAANSCPGHSYEIVRVRFEIQPNGSWKAIITYRCT